MDNSIKILLIEDEELISKNFSAILENLGYTIVGIAATAKEAYDIALNNTIDVVISDIKIQGKIDGIEACKVLQGIYNVPVIFTSAFNDEEKIKRAANIVKMIGYLIKPIRIDEIDTLIKIAVEKYEILNKKKLVQVNEQYKYDFAKNIIFDDNDEEIILTKNESILLSLLLNRQNKVLEYDLINDTFWENSKNSDLSRRQLIHRLKGKLPYFKIVSEKGKGIYIQEEE
ncbi:MAG: response regulator [Sulfurovum sp.]